MFMLSYNLAWECTTFTRTIEQLPVSAKRWTLGCVNTPFAARRNQEAGFMQPRAYLLADPWKYQMDIAMSPKNAISANEEDDVRPPESNNKSRRIQKYRDGQNLNSLVRWLIARLFTQHCNQTFETPIDTPFKTVCLWWSFGENINYVLKRTENWRQYEEHSSKDVAWLFNH